MNYKVEAVVLKSKDIKEVDRVYSVFSRQKGKLRFVGKGVRKPTAKLASGVEPITLSEIFLIQAKWLDKLTGVILVNQYPNIKKDDQKLAAVNKLFEIIDRLANEKEPNEEVFDGLLFYMDALETGQADSPALQLARLALVWKVVQWSGFQPGVFCCAGCGNKLEEDKAYWFNVSVGLQCPKCHAINPGQKIRIDKETVIVLRLFLTQPIKIFSKLIVSPKVVGQALRATQMTLEHILGKRVYI